MAASRSKLDQDYTRPGQVVLRRVAADCNKAVKREPGVADCMAVAFGIRSPKEVEKPL